MRIINKKYLVIILLVGVILTCVIVFKSKEEVKLDNVILKQEISNNMFAMYKETKNGYEEYEENDFPKGYKLNLDKSKCLDKDGNEIENALYTKNNQVGVKSNKSFYCYLYFDEKENLGTICDGSTMQECMGNSDKLNKIKTIDNLSDETKGGMYRYQGQATDVDNNYICFGTSNKDTCVNDKDHYMYRIIGIEESGRIKVIKKEALNQTYQWDTDYVTDIKLPDSVFFKAINGADFLDNQSYITTEWKDKIDDNDWLYGNMRYDSELGAKQLGIGLYDIEAGNKPTIWYVKSTQEAGGTAYQVQWAENDKYKQGTILYYKTESGNWTDTFTGKVSLMYLHDYSYALGDDAKCSSEFGKSEYSKCKDSWMHLSQNDTSAPSPHEWTMSRVGWGTWHGGLVGFFVTEEGNIHISVFTYDWSIRPVFYIESLQTISSGLGTIDNPFYHKIIK